jgi:hypothetical protein
MVVDVGSSHGISVRSAFACAVSFFLRMSYLMRRMLAGERICEPFELDGVFVLQLGDR